MKYTITLLALLGALVAVVPATSRAQDPVLRDTNSVAGRNGERLKEFMEKLKLTPEQKPQFIAAMKNQREQVQALQADTALDADAKRAKRKKILEASTAKMKTILNADQFATWEAGMKKIREGIGEGRPNHGGEGTKPLPTTPTPQN